ncbi:unnamed protein product [Protopolystoma xenopodis]|uniref:Uncharacterized protein n=1 Tax=Protopolystoma xenopodis TaxID=117903 RepID=A0A3S5BZF1_9PLAT|nr:unnamed protein product [Protopolystoma xenopodis]
MVIILFVFFLFFTFGFLFFRFHVLLLCSSVVRPGLCQSNTNRQTESQASPRVPAKRAYRFVASSKRALPPLLSHLQIRWLNNAFAGKHHLPQSPAPRSPWLLASTKLMPERLLFVGRPPPPPSPQSPCRPDSKPVGSNWSSFENRPDLVCPGRAGQSVFSPRHVYIAPHSSTNRHTHTRMHGGMWASCSLADVKLRPRVVDKLYFPFDAEIRPRQP